MWINVPLGDIIERALKSIGVTSERVEKWIGVPCNCAERREKLNRLLPWAYRVLTGRSEDAEKYLDEMIEADKKKE